MTKYLTERLEKRRGLFWLTASEVSVHKQLVLLFLNCSKENMMAVRMQRSKGGGHFSFHQRSRKRERLEAWDILIWYSRTGTLARHHLLKFLESPKIAGKGFNT